MAPGHPGITAPRPKSTHTSSRGPPLTSSTLPSLPQEGLDIGPIGWSADDQHRGRAPSDDSLTHAAEGPEPVEPAVPDDDEVGARGEQRPDR